MTNISFYTKEAHSATILDLLRQKLPQHQIHAWPDLDCDVAELSYAICWHPPAAFFDDACNLKAIFSLAAGVDNLLAHPGLPASVPIIRLVDAGMADKIAEYVHYGVLRSHRGFDKYQQLQRDGIWEPQPDRNASEYRVGILGYGAIGRTIAMKLHNAGYDVSAFKRSSAPGSDPFPVLSGDRNEFLKQLDTLVCVLPLTDETKGMINSDMLSALPEGAHFINVGRGDQVVEKDLMAALDSGRLNSALLDVCAEEPLPSSDPLWKHEKVTITPHISGPTQTTLSVDQVAASIAKLEAGAPIDELPGLVQTDRGY